MELSVLGVPREPGIAIRGAIQDIGAGGVCALTDQAFAPSLVVEGGITVGTVPVLIPTLMQVRWNQRDSAGAGYRIGLQYLLGNLTPSS